MVAFGLFGRIIVNLLHVSVESLTIAGGLLLLLVGLQMLRGEDVSRHETANVALVPLATPLLAGPGAIAAVMLLTGRYVDAAGRVGVFTGILGAVIVVAVGLLIADRIAKLLPPSAIQFTTRVLGLLLASFAVQLVVDAVRALTLR